MIVSVRQILGGVVKLSSLLLQGTCFKMSENYGSHRPPIKPSASNVIVHNTPTLRDANVPLLWSLVLVNDFSSHILLQVLHHTEIQTSPFL